MTNKRIGLIGEKIFKNKKTLAIFKLMIHFDRIRRKELKKILVKGQDINPHKDYITSRDKKTIKKLFEGYESGLLSQEQLDYGKKKFESGYVNRLYKRGIITPDSKFNSIWALDRALERLKEAGLIESKKPKKGYSYLVLNEEALILYLKYDIKYKVNFINDYDELKELNNYILKRII